MKINCKNAFTTLYDVLLSGHLGIRHSDSEVKVDGRQDSALQLEASELFIDQISVIHNTRGKVLDVLGISNAELNFS